VLLAALAAARVALEPGLGQEPRAPGLVLVLVLPEQVRRVRARRVLRALGLPPLALARPPPEPVSLAWAWARSRRSARASLRRLALRPQRAPATATDPSSALGLHSIEAQGGVTPKP
jgi:hypothetical protein